MDAALRTIDRVDVDPPDPEPTDCFPPRERVVETVQFGSGWVAVSDRQVVAYRSDREPPLQTVARPNVVGVSLRRAGGGLVVQLAQRAAVYGLLSLVVGLLFYWLAPSATVEVPKNTPVGDVLGFVELLTTGLRLAGLLAIGAGAVAVVGALGTLAYWLTTGGTVLAVERAGGDPVRCSTRGGTAHRAVERLTEALEGGDDASRHRPTAGESDPGSVGRVSNRAPAPGDEGRDG